MKKGFTLAEVLITLAIIGVVAALTIPSVILNTNQQEYKTGLKKAVSVLNQAISMNMALDNVAPSDITADTSGKNLANYLGNRMNTLQEDYNNGQFYTTDGMRFQVIKTATKASFDDPQVTGDSVLGSCTDAVPCVVAVDVNGDRKPSVAGDVNSTFNESNPAAPITGDVIKDVFYIKITGDGALPYGNVASNTMFQ